MEQYTPIGPSKEEHQELAEQMANLTIKPKYTFSSATTLNSFSGQAGLTQESMTMPRDGWVRAEIYLGTIAITTADASHYSIVGVTGSVSQLANSSTVFLREGSYVAYYQGTASNSHGAITLLPK